MEFQGRSYRNFDTDTFKGNLLERNWDDLYKLTDPGETWDFILKNITQVLDTICPVRTFKIKNYRPDWMTKELIEQIKDRDYFYKKAKVTGDADAWNIAKHLRNITNINIRQAKKDFIINELNLHNEDPKKFWKVIRRVVPTNKTSRSHDILLKDGDSKLAKEEVAHYINNFFINVGNFDAPNAPTVDDQPEDSLAQEEGISPSSLECLQNVTETEVFKIISEINVSKSSGIEDVSSFVIKEAFKVLITQVTYMFNLSIKGACFPEAWKYATVIPIPKVGNSTLVQNYRPISPLPLPGKILEKLIHNQLSNYLEGDSLLNSNQHGFRKHHSTIHSVAQLTSFINKKMDSRLPTLVAYVDFRKAFDCVQHPILLGKLAKLGIGRPIVNWVSSYLIIASGFC